MAETIKKSELYSSAQSNFKKLLEVALSSEINSGLALDDPHILQQIQEMTNSMNEPIDNCFIIPQLFKDCSEGNYDNIKEYINRGCDVNEIGPDGETALACAINANNFSIVELLLRSGANPNSRPDKNESTALMDASNVGYSDIVRVLLDFGAIPDVKSSTNNTALHYAACGGHLECCKLLLDYSQNPQALIEEQNENGHTALMEATTSGFLEITKYLEQNGAHINTHSAEFKETALTLASYKGYSEIVQYLLEAGADHEHRTDEMHTALMEAYMEGHIEAAKVLLFYGANLNMRHDSFEFPLTLAACSGHTELAAYLIMYGADIEEVNDESYTPLMEASREGHLETVALLLSLGANINRVTEETQETAMTLAACGGFYDIVLLLQRCGADIELGASTPLMEAAQEGHLEIVKSLLAIGARVDAGNSSDETSLHLAAENGHVEVCRYLLEKSAADIHHTSEGGKTCLMKACRAGNLDVVHLLVSHGAQVDQMTTTGDHTALSMACANGHCKIVEYLLQVGADPTVKLKDNCSVLIEASRAGHIDVIEILLQDNRKEKRRLLTATNSVSPNNIYSIGGGNIEPDINDLQPQQHNNYDQYRVVSNSTINNGHEHIYDHNKVSIAPVAKRVMHHPPLSNFGDYPALTGICNSDSHLATNPCSFLSTGSELLKIEDIVHAEIPGPPLDLPPLPSISHPFSLYSQSQDDVVTLPMSLFGPENDKILQNIILDPNSSNLQDWVKYMYPTFTGTSNSSLAITDASFDPLSTITISHSEIIPALTTHQTLQQQHQQQQTTSNHFHRKIKKAKHSENYNIQFDSSCQHRMPHNNNTLMTDSVDTCKLFQRSPAEGSESALKGDHFLISENIDCDVDTANNLCKDCNKFKLTNSSKENFPNAFNYPLKNNLFSTPSKQTISMPGALSMDSGVFSIEKTTTSVTTDECQTDIKRIFNSVTPNSGSTIRPKVGTIVSSTPLQKQVLQPKRRLQKGQPSSLLPISSSLSNSPSLCSDQIISPRQIKFSRQSESFVGPPGSINATVFDTIAYSSQESGMSYNHLNFPEKSLSNEERDLFFQQSLLGDFSRDSHMCSRATDCRTKHGLLSNLIPKIGVDNCDDLPNSRKTANMALSSSNSDDNLAVVEEIDNEDNDDDDDDDDDDDNGNGNEVDFDSEVEIESCAPPYNTGTSSSSRDNGCCNRDNCKKKLNVNVCTELLQESPLSLACSGGHIEVVKLLINSGAKLEHKDKKSQTALHVAVLNDHLEVVKFLLESGADMEAMVDRTKDTALSIACTNGKLEIIEELVRKSANIEHRNVSDYTPLSLAASGGYVEVIKFLLKSNAEINSRTNSKLGISPLMLAAMNGHIEAVNVLLENGSDINAQIETNRNTALTLACYQGRAEVVSLLVDKKAYIEHRAKSGLTPLMEAASQGHVDVGRILIGAGADVNAPPVPTSRETALIIAAEKGHTDFVRLLLDHNAVVDCRNKKGDTPIWLACNGGFIEVVKVLIDAMSDTNSADNRRMTCLMAAFRRGHVKIVKELVKCVTQFPTEHDCVKHLKSIKNEDKDLVNKCETCKVIILKAKERQEYEAAKNAKDLLKQVEEEKKAKEQKEVKQAKKREKKKAKKKAKHDDKDCEVAKNEGEIVEEEFIPVIQDQPILGPVVSLPPEFIHFRSPNNNNENINPEVSSAPKSMSNKRTRHKQDSEKHRSNGLDPSKPDKYYSDVLVKVYKDPVVPIAPSDSRTVNKTKFTVSNDISSDKSSFKNKATLVDKMVSANKVLEENSSWQKIGGGRKKVDIQVNKKDIGKVIGQGGSVVNAIRQIIGAHIDIDSMANDYDERTVHLKGTLEAVTKAKDYICDLVEGNINGSAVIKESEPYLTKVVTNTQKTTTEHSLSKTATELDSQKSVPSKSDPTTATRQNGKINKFGYPKLTLSSNVTVVNGSLQYGFSKSMKNTDFASVAAAGIASVSGSICPTAKVKYAEKTSPYTNDCFPSLSESTMDTVPVSSCQPVEDLKGQQSGPSNTTNNYHLPFQEQPTNVPLEVNTSSLPQSSLSHSTQSCSTILKSFPLAPGSERSMHQRTYNSTPEHSPQLEHSSKVIVDLTYSSSSDNNSTVTTSSSNSSDKDDFVLLLDGNNSFSHINFPLSVNNNNLKVSNWTTIDYHNNNINNNINNRIFRDHQHPLLHHPMTQEAVDLELMNRFPKLQTLNPKAEAFSPSFTPSTATTAVVNSNSYFRPEDFYYSMNGTLTLNPTANIFQPRKKMSNTITGTGIGTVTVTVGATVKSEKIAPIFSSSSSVATVTANAVTTSATTEERLIRLQDYTNMAINILLRTNGFDHTMAEAAFSSFMRSANLDLNTLLTTSEFIALINNIINQSTNPSPPANHISYPLAIDDSIGRLLSVSANQNQAANYRLINHNPPPPLQSSSSVPVPPPPPPAAAPLSSSSSSSQNNAHWPTMITTNFNSQSIWAPGGAMGAPPLNSGPPPFFPNLNQCVSAQAAFNSPLLSPFSGPADSSHWIGAAPQSEL